MIMETAIHINSRIIKKALGKNAAFEILDRYKWFREGSFNYGACYPLAQAFQKVLSTGTLCIINNKNHKPEHVILKIGFDTYIDANGVFTGRKLLNSWNKWENTSGLYITEYRKEALKDTGIKTNPKLVNDLVNYFKEIL